MRDTDLYELLLGIITPWTVERVSVDVTVKQVDVFVVHLESTWECPDCRRSCPLYDHSEERSWRHLDSCQFRTILHAKPPRVSCEEHGVRQVRLPWAEPKSRFAAFFEGLVINVAMEATVKGVATILGMTWDEVWGVMGRAVTRGLAAKTKEIIPTIGVDEKAIGRGQKYVTVVCDLAKGTVEYIGDDRKTSSLNTFYDGLTPDQLAGVEAVAMDMWDPYILATKAKVPGADSKIVFDRFHIMQYLGRAVDQVRRAENKELLKTGDKTLAGTRYIWLYAQENLPERYWDSFERLRQANLKTGRAWAIKESIRKLWGYTGRGWAEKLWRRWYFWATHSQLPPIVEAAQTLKRHIANILTYYEHSITSAGCESLNARIKTIQKMACGYRNKANFKTAVFFHCGGLTLQPLTHAIAG